MIPARDALERLQKGNRRFVTGAGRQKAATERDRRREGAAEQRPMAIVLGCSDSRVPPEIVFDQGIGDLFVVRVGGNIVIPAGLGSIEFAAEQFGPRLIVVLGHSRCGAVMMTLEQTAQTRDALSPNLHSIIKCIQSSLEPLRITESDHVSNDMIQRAVRANILASVTQLRQGSAILQRRIQEDGLLVTGAEYSVDTGVVEFLEDETWKL